MSPYRTEPSPNRGFAWLAGAALIALLLWVILRSGLFSSPSAQADRAEPLLTPLAVPVAVTSYLQFVEDRSAADASTSHTYSADGFRHLAAALETVTSQADVASGAREIRARADSLQQNSAATTHARQAREAALIAAGLLERIQDAGRPEAVERARQVNEAALAIKVDERLLDQTDRVQAFFRQTAQVLGDTRQRN